MEQNDKRWRPKGRGRSCHQPQTTVEDNTVNRGIWCTRTQFIVNSILDTNLREERKCYSSRLERDKKRRLDKIGLDVYYFVCIEWRLWLKIYLHLLPHTHTRTRARWPRHTQRNPTRETNRYSESPLNIKLFSHNFNLIQCFSQTSDTKCKHMRTLNGVPTTNKLVRYQTYVYSAKCGFVFALSSDGLWYLSYRPDFTIVLKRGFVFRFSIRKKISSDFFSQVEITSQSLCCFLTLNGDI